jgi:trehalose 6-phosphate phosphatase
VGRLGLVAVVSGRPVDFLAAQLGAGRLEDGGLELVGQYGLERLVDGSTSTDERAVAFVDAIATAAAEAERALPRLRLERKGGIAFVIHWRTSPERGAEAVRTTEAIATRHGLTAHPAKMAMEVRPPVALDKASAVESLLAPGFDAVAFAGDDRGDLPAFDALDRATRAGLVRHAVRIGVESPEAPPELLARADLTVPGPAGLAAVLRELGAAIG